MLAFFVATWLIVTGLLGAMSGWFSLQQWYERPSEEPFLKLTRQWGSMGTLGVSFKGILTLAAYRSGLGLSVPRIFGPFQHPFVVPWNEIDAAPSRSFLTPLVKLSLGRPANGSLKISARSWAKLVAAAPLTAGIRMPETPSISQRSMAVGMLLEWLLVTAFASSLFYVVTNVGNGPGLSLWLCILAPAVGFGIGQLMRFARQS